MVNEEAIAEEIFQHIDYGFLKENGYLEKGDKTYYQWYLDLNDMVTEFMFEGDDMYEYLIQSAEISDMVMNKLFDKLTNTKDSVKKLL